MSTIITFSDIPSGIQESDSTSINSGTEAELDFPEVQ
jgi:hypothetical protein